MTPEPVLSPSASFIVRQTAWAHERCGDLEAAERLLRSAVEADPSGLDLILDLARVLVQRGHRREALSVLRGSYSRAPGAGPRLASRIAELCHEQGDVEGAIRWYEEARQRSDPTNQACLALRIRELELLGR